MLKYKTQKNIVLLQNKVFIGVDCLMTDIVVFATFKVVYNVYIWKILHYFYGVE